MALKMSSPIHPQSLTFSRKKQTSFQSPLVESLSKKIRLSLDEEESRPEYGIPDISPSPIEPLIPSM